MAQWLKSTLVIQKVKGLSTATPGETCTEEKVKELVLKKCTALRLIYT
jgi:hypothetical protein